MSALTLHQEVALAAALDELERNYLAARQAVYTTLWFDGGGFENAKASLDGSKAAMELLRGPLLEAARGFRPWPLDEGTEIDPQGALGAWQQLAGSVRAAVDGVKAYTADWGALATLGKVGGDVAGNLVAGSQAVLIAAVVIALAFIVSKVVR